MNFEFLDIIEYRSEKYVVLFPIDDGETELYFSVDSEETLNAVFEIFKDKFKDYFNFID